MKAKHLDNYCLFEYFLILVITKFYVNKHRFGVLNDKPKQVENFRVYF